MEVTDVLRDRRREPSGLQRMAAMSIAAHVVFFATLVLAPGAWVSGRAEEPRTVMTITLGGSEGPRNGGLTALGGRPVQAQTPPEEAKRPEAVRPPAPKPPEPVRTKTPPPEQAKRSEPVRPPAPKVPEPVQAQTPPPEEARPPEPVRPPVAKAPETASLNPGAEPMKAPPPDVKQAPDDARGATPTRGAEISAGSTTAVTGARGQGFGLSTGGSPGAGATLDVADFCCPDYLVTMIERIKANWNEHQNIDAQTVVKFTIRRDGLLQEITIERPSAYPIPDLAAERAVRVTTKLPPLPGAFPNPTLTVHLNFQYQR